MRAFHPAALLVTVGALALAGCGGSDGEEAAVSTRDAAPTTTATAPTVATSTEVAPAATETTTTTTTTTAPPAATTPTTATEPRSGGTAPPSATTTASKPAAPAVDGDQPTITARANGVARTTAGDAGQAEIWCDNARQGSYDELLGDVTTLVITVSGSDATQRCELPR